MLVLLEDVSTSKRDCFREGSIFGSSVISRAVAPFSVVGCGDGKKNRVVVSGALLRRMKNEKVLLLVSSWISANFVRLIHFGVSGRLLCSIQSRFPACRRRTTVDD